MINFQSGGGAIAFKAPPVVAAIVTPAHRKPRTRNPPKTTVMNRLPRPALSQLHPSHPLRKEVFKVYKWMGNFLESLRPLDLAESTVASYFKALALLLGYRDREQGKSRRYAAMGEEEEAAEEKMSLKDDAPVTLTDIGDVRKFSDAVAELREYIQQRRDARGLRSDYAGKRYTPVCKHLASFLAATQRKLIAEAAELPGHGVGEVRGSLRREQAEHSHERRAGTVVTRHRSREDRGGNGNAREDEAGSGGSQGEGGQGETERERKRQCVASTVGNGREENGEKEMESLKSNAQVEVGQIWDRRRAGEGEVVGGGEVKAEEGKEAGMEGTEAREDRELKRLREALAQSTQQKKALEMRVEKMSRKLDRRTKKIRRLKEEKASIKAALDQAQARLEGERQERMRRMEEELEFLRRGQDKQQGGGGTPNPASSCVSAPLPALPPRATAFTPTPCSPSLVSRLSSVPFADSFPRSPSPSLCFLHPRTATASSSGSMECLQ
ncbi:hypothetical protein NSK_003769 [Nannochloropsis salina CCMP1776]|uniref:Uncharacterized protein n=1 Tax=Nannochloropsis salina CCMP1776 TaxID=1027361 RepID=A0A4D9D2Y1_9STRA|nr:hypothetical protein NSK_003769 [Nannochloropsis salina CCMP1776]|eukprot:TFJ84737.1 hypothetical protein NSK_003769 [Nannochloropsis salina CCMP1776]